MAVYACGFDNGRAPSLNFWGPLLMDVDWLGIVFQIVFWLIAMALLMRWFARSRLRERAPEDAHVLRSPPALLIVALVCLVMSVAMLIGSFSESGGIIPFVVGSAMSLLSLSLIADYYFARHHLDQQGMDYGRMLGHGGRFAWSEVRRVGFNKRMNWYRLELESGATVRISGMHMGLPEFAEHVLRHVAAERIAAPVLTMLKSAAHGKLHKVWL